jgi:hypothetical protein
MALRVNRSTKGDENPQVLRFSTKLGKAGRGASRGPGGPPYFGSPGRRQARRPVPQMLFPSQSDKRIHSGGALRRQKARQERDSRE